MCNEQTIQQTDFADQLITRQAAIDALKDMYHAAEKWGKEATNDVIKARAESCMASLIEMKLRIEKLPSAQPKRKTGKWIRTDMTDIVDGKYINWAKWNCSECGVVKKIGWAKGVNFCPNCGADMRGDEDGNE